MQNLGQFLSVACAYLVWGAMSAARAAEDTDPNAPDIRVFGGEYEITNNASVPRSLDGTDFGRVNLANRVGYSDFLITNVGVNILNLEGLTISGPHAAEFVVRSFQTGPLPPGQGSLFGIDFLPTGAGLRSALVSIANSDPDENPFQFAVQGEGELAPLIQVRSGDLPAITNGSPASANRGTDFGPVDVRAGFTARPIVIENEGSAPLDVAGWSVAGPWASEFRLPVVSPRQVALGGRIQLDLVFDPSALGERWATIWITNNAENPFRFDVRGVGIGFPKIAVLGNGEDIAPGSPTTSTTNGTDFGEVPLDGTFAFRTFTITNRGDDVLSVFAPVVAGTNGGDFVITQFPATSVPPGGSTEFSVLFWPQDKGPRQAELSLANGDPDKTPYTFAIGGLGLRVSIPQRLESPRVAGSRVQLRFGDMDGRAMRSADTSRMELQYSPTLRPGSWIPVPNSAVLEDGLILIEDAPEPSARRRFYRVIER